MTTRTKRLWAAAGMCSISSISRTVRSRMVVFTVPWLGSRVSGVWSNQIAVTIVSSMWRV